MNFALYPHDTQECKIQIESCKYAADHLQKHDLVLYYSYFRTYTRYVAAHKSIK